MNQESSKNAAIVTAFLYCALYLVKPKSTQNHFNHIAK